MNSPETPSNDEILALLKKYKAKEFKLAGNVSPAESIGGNAKSRGYAIPLYRKNGEWHLSTVLGPKEFQSDATIRFQTLSTTKVIETGWGELFNGLINMIKPEQGQTRSDLEEFKRRLKILEQDCIANNIYVLQTFFSRDIPLEEAKTVLRNMMGDEGLPILPEEISEAIFSEPKKEKQGWNVISRFIRRGN
jgi:hypothetical protein